MNRQPHVLIVEDDPWFAKQHIRILEKSGCTATWVADGIAAIAALDEQRPDAIVLDLFLPGPNAIVLLHEIQSYADLATIPVIICSGRAADVSRHALKSYGVVDVLDKATMQPADLVAAVKRELL